MIILDICHYNLHSVQLRISFLLVVRAKKRHVKIPKKPNRIQQKELIDYVDISPIFILNALIAIITTKTTGSL